MIDCAIVLAMSLVFFCYRVWRRLDSLERSLIERITREVREIERRQAEREEGRLRLLVDSAGQVGSVKGVTELLAGLLAQMSAKLDRHVALPVQASVS
jgi:hypothetical protein